MQSRVRELSLLNLGIDGQLHGCDVLSLKVRDVWTLFEWHLAPW